MIKILILLVIFLRSSVYSSHDSDKTLDTRFDAETNRNTLDDLINKLLHVVNNASINNVVKDIRRVKQNLMTRETFVLSEAIESTQVFRNRKDMYTQSLVNAIHFIESINDLVENNSTKKELTNIHDMMYNLLNTVESYASKIALFEEILDKLVKTRASTEIIDVETFQNENPDVIDKVLTLNPPFLTLQSRLVTEKVSKIVILLKDLQEVNGEIDYDSIAWQVNNDANPVSNPVHQCNKLSCSLQLGVDKSIVFGKPLTRPQNNDFEGILEIEFPKQDIKTTSISKFTFKSYAPVAFNFIRHMFGVEPQDYVNSLCTQPLRQISNPGASGSELYTTFDDKYIIKTVSKMESEFMVELLERYYKVRTY